MSGRVTFKDPNLVIDIIEEYYDELGKEKKDYFHTNAWSLSRRYDSPLVSSFRNIPLRFTEKYHSRPDEEYGEIYTAYRVNYEGYDVLIEDTSGEQEEIPLVPDELFIIKE